MAREVISVIMYDTFIGFSIATNERFKRRFAVEAPLSQQAISDLTKVWAEFPSR